MESALPRDRGVSKLSSGLNQREENFCQAFMRSGDATAAYKESGYTAPSEGAARVYAHRLLGKATIKVRLAHLRQAATNVNKMDTEYFLTRLKHNIETAAELGDYAASNKAIELGMRWASMIGEKVTPAAQTNVALNLFNTGNDAADLSRLANVAGYKLAAPKKLEKSDD